MAARDLFERIRSEGWPLVERWQTDAETESVILDFKRAMTTGADLDARDRDSLAKAMSAFANTDGGVVVFGVDARRGAKGAPDVVQDIAPVPDAKRFAEQLRSIVLNVVAPTVQGIDVAAVTSPNTDAGIVAVLVPRSLGGPHRVETGPEKMRHHYFARTADSSYVMPHRQLAALFAAPAEPQLVLRVHRERGGLTFSLANNGPGSARAIRLVADVRPPSGEIAEKLYIGSGPFARTMTDRTREWVGRGHACYLAGSERLYPEDVTQVSTIGLAEHLDFTGSLLLNARVDSETTRPLVVSGRPLGLNENWAFALDYPQGVLVDT